MALKVGELYAALTLKDDGFEGRISKARSEMVGIQNQITQLQAKNRELSQSLRTASEEEQKVIRQQMLNNSRQIDHLRMKSRELKASIREWGQEARNAAKETREAGQHMEDVFHGIRTAALYASAGLAIGFGAAAYAGVKANSDTQQFLATMTRLTGSTEKAKAELQKLKEFAKSTPFEMSDLKQGELVMRAVGLSTDKWRQTIGDTAAAWKSAGKSYMDVVQAIADAQTGELERLKEFGITKAQIVEHGHKLMRNKEIVNNKGQITDTVAFNNVLLDLLKQRYGGMMQVQSQTFAGMMSNIKDFGTAALEVLSKPLFNKLNAGAKSAMDKLQELQSDGTLDVWAERLGENLDSVIGFFKNINWEAVGTAAKFTIAAAATAGLAVAIGRLGLAFRALFASMGPIGWAVTGISLLVGMSATYEDQTTRLSLAQIKQYEAGLKQTEANDKLIDSYEQLRNKATWTNDEFLRYLDLQTLIKKETDPSKIKEYQQEMDKLAKNSGLSKQEIGKLLQLNKDMIKEMPKGSQKISEQGNAVATLTDHYRKLNAEKRKEFATKLEEQRIQLLAEEPKLLDQIKAKREEANKEDRAAKAIAEQIMTERQKLKDMEDKLADPKTRETEKNRLLGQILNQKQLVAELSKEYDQHIKNRDAAREEVQEAQNKLKQLKDIQAQLTSIYDTDIKQAQEQINANNKKIAQLEEAKKKHGANVGEIDKEIQRLKDSNTEMQNVVNTANDLKKRLQEAVNKAEQLNAALGKTIHKKIILDSQGLPTNVVVPGNPATQRRHSGGQIMKVPGIGGEVPALLKGGETVLTSRQTNELVRMLENGSSGNQKGGNTYNIYVNRPDINERSVVDELKNAEWLYS